MLEAGLTNYSISQEKYRSCAYWKHVLSTSHYCHQCFFLSSFHQQNNAEYFSEVCFIYSFSQKASQEDFVLINIQHCQVLSYLTNKINWFRVFHRTHLLWICCISFFIIAFLLRRRKIKLTWQKMSDLYSYFPCLRNV